MADVDVHWMLEISRALGRIEGKVDRLQEEVDELKQETVQRTESLLGRFGVPAGGAAGVVGVAEVARAFLGGG